MSHLNDIIMWLGFTNDDAFPNAINFWSSPVGLFITSSIFICSCINMLHPGIDDNLFDRIWYSCTAIVMLCAFVLGVHPGTNPHHIVQSLMYLLCARFIASVLIKHRRYKQSGTPQKTLGM